MHIQSGVSCFLQMYTLACSVTYKIETSEVTEEDEVIIVSSLPSWDFCYF